MFVTSARLLVRAAANKAKLTVTKVMGARTGAVLGQPRVFVDDRVRHGFRPRRQSVGQQQSAAAAGEADAAFRARFGFGREVEAFDASRAPKKPTSTRKLCPCSRRHLWPSGKVGSR